MSYKNPKNPDKILKLCCSLHDTDRFQMEMKVNKYLQQEISDSSLVFLVLMHRHTMCGSVRVLGLKQLDHDIRFPIRLSVMYKAVCSRDTVIVHFKRLNKELQETINIVMESVPETFLCVPVVPPDDKVITVLCCVIDPTERYTSVAEVVEGEENLTTHQQKISGIVKETFSYCAGAIVNAMLCEEKARLYVQSQSLLNVAQNLFHNLHDVSGLLRVIMAEARRLTFAERCSLFLIDREQNVLTAKVFDGISQIPEVRIPLRVGAAGYVAATGEMLNIRDAYKHPLFYQAIDLATGFKTRNLLCFPILENGEVIAVAELCNKIGGEYFTCFDEEIAQAFSSYCGISIMHTRVYQKAVDAQARYKLSRELMMYHMQVGKSDVEKILLCKNDHSDISYNDFSYAPRDTPEEHTVCLIVEMFANLGLLDLFEISQFTFVRFVLYVKKGYRDEPYHNWMHAFAVTHFGYLLIKKLQLIGDGWISSLEALAFLIACLCHDIDHRGTTNSFQRHAGTVLASLYSSQGSVMERHHFNQTVCILNMDECNILEKLHEDQYTKCLDWIQHIILATDLADHFRIWECQKKMVKNFIKGNDQSTGLLLSMLVTCCDLSDQTKDWHSARKIVELIYKEFFKQGDLERGMGSMPSEMMDREKAKIPELQIQFLSNVVIPLFELLGELFPLVSLLPEACKRNLKCWSFAADIFSRRSKCGQTALEILANPEFENEVLTLMALL